MKSRAVGCVLVRCGCSSIIHDGQDGHDVCLLTGSVSEIYQWMKGRMCLSFDDNESIEILILKLNL